MKKKKILPNYINKYTYILILFIFFLEPVADYVKAVVDTALKIHEDEDRGDILAFLTGMEEVDRAVNLLEEHAKLVKDGKRNEKFYK